MGCPMPGFAALRLPVRCPTCQQRYEPTADDHKGQTNNNDRAHDSRQKGLWLSGFRHAFKLSCQCSGLLERPQVTGPPS